MATELKRTVKDSVFNDLFKIPENQLALFNSIHPELPDVTVEDISYATLTPVLLNLEYNDLSIIVRDRFLIFMEAQSTWSWNILIRSLLYVAQTYKEYIDAKELDLYREAPLPLPKPELYVIFTGDRKNVPDVISMADAYFGGEQASIDITARVIHDPNSNGILGEYISFCRILQEQRNLYGPTRKAIEETIRLCQEHGKLADYLKTRRKEVVTIMEELFSFETSMERIITTKEVEARTAGRAEGRAEGRLAGRTEGAQQEKKKTALFLLKNHMTIPFIMEATDLAEDEIKQIAAENSLLQ